MGPRMGPRLCIFVRFTVRAQAFETPPDVTSLLSHRPFSIPVITHAYHALHGWAETSRRGRDASIVVQLILSEHRRVGGETLLRSEVDCLVSNAICLEPQRRDFL